MVGTTTLKFYNLESMDDYYTTILDQHNKSSNKIARELFDRFSKPQMKDFLTWMVLHDRKKELIHFIKLV